MARRISCPAVHKMIEEELSVEADGKTDGSLAGDQSGDIAGEMDWYVDALTIMVSEMETENGYKPKNVLGEMQENTGQSLMQMRNSRMS